MKTNIRPSMLRRGFTLIELLVVISIIAIIAALAMPAFSSFMLKGRMADQLNNGRQIYLGLRSYAAEISHGGSFPAYKDIDDASTLVQNSNEAFEILVPRYLDDKRAFANKNSAWCKTTTKNENTKDRVMPGENDWVYVRGLKDSAPSNWPILANAFAPGTTTYIKDQSKPGGVWKGANAIVVWAGGSAEQVSTKEQGESYFVKRPDKPTADAFKTDTDWLSGEEVQVLYPQSN
jgi:prepilin-type N-terminal cleavage/methylation domain-containing protein